MAHSGTCGEAFTPFRQHVWRLPMSKNIIPSYLWKRHKVFHLLEWCVLWWWSGLLPVNLFFFPFFSISFSENYNLTLLVVSISTLILFFSFFYLDSFVEILFVFNFIIESKFIKYYILQFGSYYLDF